ncbi:MULTISPECIES: sugar transferase [unclassified Streptococcus]|uniref:sugar transferase n=1 Tax=unclassified Streptococcus TaxID=2608887 RepID=UPI0018AC0CDE|nr:MULTISPECIES: sugar transferase [unclassified Streptococcus]MBF8970456.1 sugar transferase [Streptococcus sp. NLN76]MBG9366829.1 sugar transferase [Streptococcus sp. NLN64]
MRVYITNLNGQAAQSTAQIAQNMVTDIATSLGYRELGIYAYNMHADTEVELSKRLDGIVAGLRHGDVVIFQTPTWNTTDFDVRLMNKLKAYHIKIVIFIHDVVPLMFAGNYYLMDRTIEYYNKADVIVAPSQRMLTVLREVGLTVEKTLVQGMWDHPTDVPQAEASFKKEIHFPGSPDRFSFVKDWSYELPLHLYTWKQVDLPPTVNHRGYLPDTRLLMELSEGGFGLVWMDDHDKEYQTLYCPYKLGTFLAAGIPVIVQKGIANQEIIEANGLGFVVESMDEAVAKIEAMNEAEYQTMVERVRSFNPLLRQGYFSRRLLTESVFQALNKGGL